MFEVLNQFMVPSSLDREVFERGITPEQISLREDFQMFMREHDRAVAACAKKHFYLGIFWSLTGEERFMPLTADSSSYMIKMGDDMSMGTGRLARGLSLCAAITGPNEVLRTAVSAHDFLTTVDHFAKESTIRIVRRDQRKRIVNKSEVIRSRAALVFVEAIKAHLGLASRDGWSLPKATRANARQR